MPLMLPISTSERLFTAETRKRGDRRGEKLKQYVLPTRPLLTATALPASAPSALKPTNEFLSVFSPRRSPLLRGSAVNSVSSPRRSPLLRVSAVKGRF